MRRVLELRTVSGRGGGPEKTLLNTPRYLADAYQTRLVYIRPAGDATYDMPERARDLGVELVDIAERGPLAAQTVRRLYDEVRQYRADLLHAHDYKTNLLAVLLGRWFRIPVMTTMHGYVTCGGRLELYYCMDRWALRRMDHIVAVSEDLCRQLDEWQVPAHRYSLIENAIDTEQYTRVRPAGEAKRRLGLSPDRLTIGAVGRLSPEKGFDLLIRAADRLLRAGFDFHLLLIGDGPQRRELETLIAQLDRSDKVRLLGYRADAVEAYEAMDVFALSSLREGLPNVVLEAMTMEVPVVATRVAGLPRLVTCGENGLLVEPGDVEALAEALRRLLGDAALRRRLGRAGRETVEARYSFGSRMQKIRAIYDDLLGRNGSCDSLCPTQRRGRPDTKAE